MLCSLLKLPVFTPSAFAVAVDRKEYASFCTVTSTSAPSEIPKTTVLSSQVYVALLSVEAENCNLSVYCGEFKSSSSPLIFSAYSAAIVCTGSLPAVFPPHPAKHKESNNTLMITEKRRFVILTPPLQPPPPLLKAHKNRGGGKIVQNTLPTPYLHTLSHRGRAKTRPGLVITRIYFSTPPPLRQTGAQRDLWSACSVLQYPVQVFLVP